MTTTPTPASVATDLHRLIDLLNHRPAMNAGLQQAYAAWTAEVYDVMGAMHADPANDGAALAAPARASLSLPFQSTEGESNG